MTKSQKLSCILILLASHASIAQKADSTRSPFHVAGAIAVTNNGISLLPTFSLGDPATVMEFSMGRRQLTFEPQIRWALAGKPWSFVFWWRYRFFTEGKFRLQAGLHPAVLYRTVTVINNGATTEYITAQRYFAGELAPNYLLSRNISAGFYYLHSQGFSESGTKQTDFITFNFNFSRIGLSKSIFLRFSPQVYYLQMDKVGGTYVTAAITLLKDRFPFSVSTIMNKSIETDIPNTDEFVWNLSLVYNFRKEFTEKERD